MKRIVLLLSPIFISVAIFAGVTYFINQDSGKGALQVTARPESDVYLDGKLVGNTPFCIGGEQCKIQDMIKTGEHTVRIVPKDSLYSPYETKISVSELALTVVNRTFRDKTSSSGNVISLTPISDEKKAELFVLSFPDKGEVFLDSNYMGKTPLLLENLTESDHDLEVTKEGYIDEFVKIRTTTGYRLEAVVSLGVDPNFASPSSELENELEDEIEKVEILNTPTGFLRVREASTTASLEIGRVSPGETYEIVTQGDGWFEIKLEEGKTGWISGQYAEKQ